MSKSNLFTLSAPDGAFCGFSADECAVLRSWLDDGGFSADYLAGGGFLLETDECAGEWYYSSAEYTYTSREWIAEEWEDNKDFLREEYECETLDELLDALTDMGGPLTYAPPVVYAWSADGIGFSPDAWREDLVDVLDDIDCYFCDPCHSARRHAVTIWRIALPGNDGSEKQKEEKRALLLDAIDEALASWDFDDAERLQIELSQM